jgi:hypothetical protein
MTSMVLFLRLGALARNSAEWSGTGQEAKGALPPVSLSCLSRQLEVLTSTRDFDVLPAAPVAAVKEAGSEPPAPRNQRTT